MKRVIALLSAVLILSGAAGAFAADTDYAFAFQPNGENTAVITGVYAPYTFMENYSYKRYEPEDPVSLVFPKEIDNYTITELSLIRQTNNYVGSDGYPFDYCTSVAQWKRSVTSIEIPETVKRIDCACFASCEHLERVILPEGLEEIDDLAFSLCPELKEVVFPSTLRRIGKRAFAQCSQLTSVTIPAGVEIIDEEAFASCGQLETVKLEGNTTEIRGNNCFEKWTKVERPAGEEPAREEKVLEGTFKVRIEGTKVILTGFTNSTALPEPIIIPEGVTDIAHMDFHSLLNETVVLPSTLTGDIVPSEEEDYRVDWEVAEGNPRYRAVNNMLIDQTAHTLVCGSMSDNPVIPKGVKMIGDYAFHSRTLKSVTIPDGVEVIGKHAFSSCQLKEVTLPDSIREIGEFAFADNHHLSVFNFPESLEKCYASAFWYTEVTLPLPLCILSPETVESLDHYAGKATSRDGVWEYVLFEDDSCAIVGFNKPQNAKGTLSIPAKIDGHPTVAVVWTATCCYDYDALKIPEGVRFIAKQAFMNYTVRKVTFPKSLEVLDPEAFYQCDKLEFSDSQIDRFPFLARRAPVMPFLYRFMPDGTVEIVDWKDSKQKSAVIPAEIDGCPVTSVGPYAFSDVNLTSVTLPESVRSIGYCAFSYASRLQKIILPEGLRFIGAEAFWSCPKLTGVSFPSTLVYIGSDAFAETGLKQANLPDGLVYLGERAFAAGKLTGAVIPGSVGEIRPHTFHNQPDLKKVTVGDGVSVIGDYAFMMCGLQTLDLPDSVKRIAQGAFYECESLKTVSIGDGCEEIMDDAFFYCGKLSSVNLGNSLRTIGTGAFFQHGMKEITLPASLETAREGSLFPRNYHNPFRVNFSGDAGRFSFSAFMAYDMDYNAVFPDRMTFGLPEGAAGLRERLETYMQQNGLSEKQWKIVTD